MGEGPPSTTASILSPRLWRTARACVHGARPVIFALVPVSKPPHLWISFNATRFRGHLIAIVFRRIVSEWGKLTLGLRTMVSGPGQNLEASAFALLSITAIRLANACEATSTGNGSLRLSLIDWSFLRALSFHGSHPRPYTVSVGKATTPPSFTILAALRMSPRCVDKASSAAHHTSLE